MKNFSMISVLNKSREHNCEIIIQDLQIELLHVKKKINEIK